MRTYTQVLWHVEHDMEETFERIGETMKEMGLSEAERVEAWKEVEAEYRKLLDEPKIDAVDFAKFYNK